MTEAQERLVEEKAKIRARFERYAQRAGLRLNPDSAVVDELIHGLAARKERYGFAYCPCRIVSGDRESDKKIVCPCAYHKDEIAKTGACVCGLFVKG